MPERGLGVAVGIPGLALDGVPLFDRFRFQLEAGRWTCLLGPSGIGKTTLLRVVAGLQPGGLVLADDGSDLRRRIAWMAQQDLLLPWLSVLDNVLLGPRLRGASRAELRRLRAPAQALLVRVGLGDRADSLPATLSGGMRQRAALARTLMEDRPVVLMDEPFSALDAITRHRLQDLAAELLAGRTILLVTHSPLEALRLGHRVFVLSGRPAQARGPLLPRGAPPRDVADPTLIAHEAELLGELTRSAALQEAS